FFSLFIFFFSSRRRHTRFSRDWSSDVCSSDLHVEATLSSSVTANIEATPAATFDLTAFEIRGYRLRADFTDADGDPVGSGPVVEIGRASCRERVEIAVGAVVLRRKSRMEMSIE